MDPDHLKNISSYFLPAPPAPPSPYVTPPYVIAINSGVNSGTGVWLTVPKDLAIPESHRHLENEIHYWLHTILQGDFNRKHDLDRTTRINRKLMRQILGHAKKESAARKWLLDESRPHVIYTDTTYSSGHFSQSYGLNPIYRKSLTRWEVTNARLANRIKLARLRRLDIRKEQADRRTDILDYLEDWAKRITIDLDACRAVPGAATYHLMPAESIFHKDYVLTRDDYGRVHSPYTQLWRPLRPLLRLDGEPLTEIDIRNSQIVFLVGLLKEHLLAQGQVPTPDQRRFVELVEAGEIYDHLLVKAQAIPDYLRRKTLQQDRLAKWHERFLIHVCASVRPRSGQEWAAARRNFLRRVPIKSVEVATTGGAARRFQAASIRRGVLRAS